EESSPQKAMNKPEHFEIHGNYAVFRPTGKITMEQGVRMVRTAIIYARDHQIGKLMVVTTGVAALKPLDLATRREYLRDLARTARGKLCMAIVARQEMIDYEKIGVIIAGTAGFQFNIFEMEEEALDWLQSVRPLAKAGEHHALSE